MFLNCYSKKGDKVLSLKVLSTLAELDLENEELYKTISYLLKQRGNYEKRIVDYSKDFRMETI